MRTLCAVLLVVWLGAFAAGCKRRAASTDPGTAEPARSQVVPESAVALPAVGRGTAPAAGTSGSVGPDGHVDLVTVLNERLSRGVTPENNANAAIWKAFGPTPASGETLPPGFFEKLGIPEPKTGDSFVGLRAYCNRHAPDQEQVLPNLLTYHSTNPWKAADSAVMATWLGANEKPLDALREAVKLPHYYNPLIPLRGEKGSKGLLTAPLPGVPLCREAAVAFACRAMLNLEQKPDEAWQDLLACHRLARQVGRGGTLIESMGGLAIEQIACRAEIAYLNSAGRDAGAVERCLRDLAALPPMAPVADKIDLYERFMFLDAVSQFRRQGSVFLHAFAEPGNQQNQLTDWVLEGVDWVPAAERGNKWFDRLVSGTREPIRANRLRSLAQVRTDLGALRAEATDFGRVTQMLRDGNYSGKAKGEAIGDILITLMLPAAHKVVDAEDRAQQLFDTVAVGYAVVWYQRLNGRYPDSLAPLAPNYLTTVPGDLFSGKGLIYQPGANGFLLYSVGANGTDEGGRWNYDLPPGDDIAVRIPLLSKP